VVGKEPNVELIQYFTLECAARVNDLFLFFLSFSTDQNTTAFKEVAIIRHPRVGEYAFGFITSSVILQVEMQRPI
jgi:hypothetical protein